jgi:hypothetical protein
MLGWGFLKVYPPQRSPKRSLVDVKPRRESVRPGRDKAGIRIVCVVDWRGVGSARGGKARAEAAREVTNAPHK